MKLLSVGRMSLICVLSLALTTRAYALFGVGDIVFDPSAFAKLGQQLLQMEQQYRQIVQNYQMLRSQYDHIVRMSRQVPVAMSSRYRALATPWQSFAASDTYGATSGWVESVNTGVAVASAYARNVETLSSYGAPLNALPPGQATRLKATHASVELTDGANLNALSTVGRLRGNARAVELAVQRLEDDSLSGAADMNTEIAVLNKINAASVVAIRTAQDANKLLVSLAEQQVLEAKRVRDAEARAINQHARFLKDARAVVVAQAAGASQAMRAWRMP